MIFSAITPKDIWKSFLNLQDTISFNFAIAGETRHIVDWIYGINLSRALTHAIRHYSKKVVLSIGRVQGPTLKLIFEREVEIRNFVPDEFFTIIAEVYKDGKILRFRHLKERFRTKEEALREKSKIGKFITIKQVNAFLEKINPPVPYNLTDLQTDAYKYYKITPKQTLTIAQSLYEQGYISYPRTSSQKLPDTIDFRYILSNLQKILSYKTFASSLLNKSILKPYNGKKDDVHPAIHPTGLIPSKLSQNEWKIYDLICRRFLSCFFEPARVRKLRVITEEGLFFDYKSVLHKGWLSVYWRWVKDDFSNFEFEKGESLQVKRVSVRKQKTKPPSRYNPASIVKKMEELNIGTKATRAEIVQILYKRKYIEGKSIKITDLGERIVSLFDKYLPEILDVQLTRRLERDLELIERGKIELRDKVIETVKEVVRNVCLEIKEREKEIGKSLYEVYKKL
jgi:DNA topoisomerase-1